MNALVTQRSAFTFNAAKLSTGTKQRLGISGNISPQISINAYIITNDPLTKYRLPDYTNLEKLEPIENKGWLPGHSINNFLNR